MTSMSSSSESFSIADRPLASMSQCARCEPKMKSFTSRWNASPTAADSCPMPRCAGPGWLYAMPSYSPVVLIRWIIVSKWRSTSMSR